MRGTSRLPLFQLNCSYFAKKQQPTLENMSEPGHRDMGTWVLFLCLLDKSLEVEDVKFQPFPRPPLRVS